ncbi:C6 zinc finger domain-containing protein, partial [Colletotrichum musicola]
MNKTGRSHAGCLACKARKVKCDEEKPSCRRCIRLKRECPGYRDTWDTMHRQENEHVAQLVQVRVTRKLRERRDQEMTTAGGSSSGGGRLVLPRPVLVDAADCTLNHFYRDYSLNSGVAFFGILPSVSTSRPVPCFFDAIHAVAFASSSRQLLQSELMARARRHYGRAVVGLNQAIQAPESAKSDSVLVALYLMGLFEAIIAQPSLSRPIDTESSCHPHSRGGIMLLEYRSRLGISGDLDRMVMASFSYIAVMEYFVSPPGFAPLWTQVTNFKSSWAEGPCLEPLVARAV